jgi:hypothetical protein
VRFEVDARDPNAELVIDPEIEFVTYYGGPDTTTNPVRGC